MKYNYFISIALIGVLFGCHISANRKAAMRLADQALHKYYSNILNNDSTDRALFLLDSSIKLYPDPMFYLFKYQIYRGMNRQLAALKVCDTVLMIDRNNYFATLFKGYAFEAIGKSDSAFEYYKAALRIVEDPASFKASEMVKDHEKIVLVGLLKDTTNFNKLVSEYRIKYRSTKGYLFELYNEEVKEFTHFRRQDYVEHQGYVNRDTSEAAQSQVN